MLGIGLSVLLLLAANTAMEGRQGTPGMKLLFQGCAFAVDTPALECSFSYSANIYSAEPACWLQSNIVISSDLIDLPLSWMCCRTTKYFFHPAPPRSRKRAFIAILLLMAGVERNPGSTQNPESGY